MTAGLKPDTVLVRWMHVEKLADQTVFDRAMAALPWEERRTKILRIQSDKVRRLSLGAGLLAARMLEEAGAEDLGLTVGERGKPQLALADDLHFNLSHAGEIAVCAVSDVPVGVDVEKPRGFRSGVADRCMQPEELQWIREAENPETAFLKLWTRKESFLKMGGEGLTLDMRSFNVLTAGDTYAFSETVTDGHLICVCAPKEKRVEFMGSCDP